MANILEINNLNYRDWKNINLSFEMGKIYFITGGNNSGKTTLFRMLFGSIKTSNYIVCDDVYYNEHSRMEYIKKIGVVNRVGNHSFVYKNVFDEMMYPLYNLNFHRAAIVKRVNEILSLFEMEAIKEKSIKDLSMSEKQILLIMISILHYPKVLLLDNVLELLMVEEREKIIKKLKELTKKGLCVINFTSDLSDALVADKIILLNHFNIIREMPAIEMFNDDKVFYENGLEVPFICDLNIKLKTYQMIDKNFLNMKELVDELWQ